MTDETKDKWECTWGVIIGLVCSITVILTDDINFVGFCLNALSCCLAIVYHKLLKLQREVKTLKVAFKTKQEAL